MAYDPADNEGILYEEAMEVRGWIKTAHSLPHSRRPCSTRPPACLHAFPALRCPRPTSRRSPAPLHTRSSLQTIHAIQRDGTIMKGSDALKKLYSAVGLGWAAQFGDLPIISTVSCCSVGAAA